MSLKRPLKNRFQRPKSASIRLRSLSKRELFSCQNLIYWILKNDPQNRLKNRFETPKSLQNQFRGSKSAQNRFQAPKFLSKPLSRLKSTSKLVSSTRKPFKIFFLIRFYCSKLLWYNFGKNSGGITMNRENFFRRTILTLFTVSMMPKKLLNSIRIYGNHIWFVELAINSSVTTLGRNLTSQKQKNSAIMTEKMLEEWKNGTFYNIFNLVGNNRHR